MDCGPSRSGATGLEAGDEQAETEQQAVGEAWVVVATGGANEG